MAAALLGLDAAFVDRLDCLSILARRRGRGSGAGPRRSMAIGSSVEFADFRTYAEGDDYRRIDWNAFGRLERLFLRIFEAEENTTVTIFIDCSRSMAFGSPSKALVARQIAASLAYVALASYDRVAVAALDNRLARYLPPRSGRARAPEVWRFIADLEEGGASSLESLAAFSSFRPAAGLSIVLSDVFTEDDWRKGLRALLGPCRQDVTLLQILAPEELHPSIAGDRALVDSETGERVEISRPSEAISRYHAALASYTGELNDWCRRNAVPFAQVAADTPIEDLLTRVLTRVGVVR